jgi:endonuclease G
MASRIPGISGHVCPSADRTKDLTNNQVTFRMSNIIPQHANNNQGLWATFENYTRTLASGGNEVLILTGPAEFSGSTIANGMVDPGSVWKSPWWYPTPPAPPRPTKRA